MKKTIDLDKLPPKVRDELIDFYQFLLIKYNIKIDDSEEIDNEIKQLLEQRKEYSEKSQSTRQAWNEVREEISNKYGF